MTSLSSREFAVRSHVRLVTGTWCELRPSTTGKVARVGVL